MGLQLQATDVGSWTVGDQSVKGTHMGVLCLRVSLLSFLDLPPDWWRRPFGFRNFEPRCVGL